MRRQQKRISRREFLGHSLFGLGCFGLARTKGSPFGDRHGVIQRETPEREPIRRSLGKTGLRLPIVSLGVMNADNPDLVRRAVDLGVRHFDTAHGYQRGRNEAMVGSVIQELGVREKTVIATKAMTPSERQGKTPQQAKQNFIKAVEESLRRLRTDYIDILYVHDIKDAGEINNPGITEALALLKDQKKTRFVGFSTHANMAACIEEACRGKFYDVVLTTFNYALADDTELLSSFQKARDAGIGLIAMKTQCSQYWYRDSLPPSQQRYYEGQILHSALLKWALRHDVITTAVPGCTTLYQLETDWQAAFDLAYTQEEERFFQNRKIKTELAYCVQCSRCVSTCPQAVDIPSLMRTHMYLTCYSNPSLASQTLEGVSRSNGLQACSSCDSCRANCSRGVPVVRRIGELKLALA
ncbi:MAG: aldo/keto reductase [Clostridiales bacterium]|nr:aldo/keto reductase [Clostridiales bacterium]